MNHSLDYPLPRVTTRATLRRFAAADLANFQSYRGDAELGQYQGWSPMPELEAEAFINEMQSCALFMPGIWCQIAIASNITNELLGDIGICVASDQRTAEIGFTVKRQSQGSGIATDAVREAISILFECTSVQRVLGITDTRNLSSIRLLERVGMQKVLTNAAIFKGEACMESTFSVARQHGVKPIIS